MKVFQSILVFLIIVFCLVSTEAAETPNLELPGLEFGQSQQYILVNEAFQTLDYLVFPSVLGVATDAAATSAQPGDAWIVSSTGISDNSNGLGPAVGEFAGKENHIAMYKNGIWDFLQPGDRWAAVDITNKIQYRYMEAYPNSFWLKEQYFDQNNNVSFFDFVAVSESPNGIDIKALLSTASNYGELILYDSSFIETVWLSGESPSAINKGLVIGGGAPHSSANFHVMSADKGTLLNPMSTTERNAIPSPATGLIVTDTTVNKLSVYDGTAWRYLAYE